MPINNSCHIFSRPLKTHSNQTKTTHFANHLNQQNCFLSSATKNLRYFTKNKPSFCQNKQIVAITSLRHFRHVKTRAKAKKALTRLRTIANKLIRELQRKLHPHSLFETYQKDFLFYQLLSKTTKK
jgi:hypothetical protein